ncbi:MAG: anthranilate synthase component I family protein [Cyanobacteria bacterium REEB67]|nr:anthranilate synthase component I family protein [Cyanobacteria bacterium REEB67]
MNVTLKGPGLPILPLLPTLSLKHKLEEAVALSFSADLGTPVAIFEKIAREQQYAFLFEATEGDSRLARYSFLSCDPCLTIAFKDGLLVQNDGQGRNETPVVDPLAYLQATLAQFQSLAEAAIARALKKGDSAPHAGPNGANDQHSELAKFLEELPFIGGLVGYMGYGANRYMAAIPQQSKDPTAVPDGYYALYDSVIVFDHQFRRIILLSLRGRAHAEQLLELLLAGGQLKPLKLDLQPLTQAEIFENVTTSVSREKFIDTVEAAKEYLREGQAFQIVVSQRFSVPAAAPPINIYRMLQATNPSPYAYFLKYPDFVYLGSSPETFVQCQKKKLMLRAIAGTRKRGLNAEEDLSLGAELRADEKEMAEHRMLVDLGRNDLGRVAQPGTVKVGELACLSKYTHVMHLETEITASLDPSESAFSAFQSCFPAGTVSGAPKVRAMQLLAQLEPERRGIYSGAVGYFDLRGHMDGAIAIRSALIKDGTAYANAGAGIVYDSQPEAEYEETRNKAKGVLQAILLAEKEGSR